MFRKGAVLLTPEEINEEAANSIGILFAPGDSTVIQQSGLTDDKDGIGPGRPEANPGDGLGNGASATEPALMARLAPLLPLFLSFLR